MILTERSSECASCAKATEVGCTPRKTWRWQELSSMNLKSIKAFMWYGFLFLPLLSLLPPLSPFLSSCPFPLLRARYLILFFSSAFFSVFLTFLTAALSRREGIYEKKLDFFLSYYFIRSTPRRRSTSSKYSKCLR